MFVYQNKAGHICVTFTDNKPVNNPEYVIAVDKSAKKLYMVSGTIEGIPEQDEEVVEETVVIETPKVEELDDVVENDTMQNLEFAPVTEADNSGAPSIEELDDVIENDAPVVEETIEEDKSTTDEDAEA